MDEPPQAPHPSGLSFDSQQFTSVSAWATDATGNAIRAYINENETQAAVLSQAPSNSMIPPWDGVSITSTTSTGNVYEPAYLEDLVKFKLYDQDFVARPMNPDDIIDDVVEAGEALEIAGTERGAGDNYVYANGRTFAYPQHERVYFIGTFHEDFHLKDGFADPNESWTGEKEQFNFPEPGKQYPENTSAADDADGVVNPKGIRGVSEDKRWGDQLFYAYGRKFSWSAGPQLGDGGAFGEFNYGNGYTENLITESGGMSDTITGYSSHKDKWDNTSTWNPSAAGGVAGALGIANKWVGTGIVSNIMFWESKASPDGLKGATQLDPAITLADKTFGHTYSYHMGLAIGIHEGNSISRTYGHTEDMVEGDSEIVVKGDSYDTTYGSTSSMFLGAKHEITMGIDNEMKLALDNTIHVGIETGIQLAGFLKFTAGFGVDVTVGPIFEGKQFDAEAAIGKLETKITKIENTQVVLKNRTTTMDNTVTELRSLALHLGSCGLFLQG
jgi:hypothetical protein